MATTVRFNHPGRPIGFDALAGKTYQPCFTISQGRTEVKLELEPYESTFILFHERETLDLEKAERKLNRKDFSPGPVIDGPWKVSTAGALAGEYPHFTLRPEINGPGNISVPALLPDFSGTLLYETTFDYQKVPDARNVYLDLGEVYEIAEVRLNGKNVGVKICPPYRLEVTDALNHGKNQLQIEVTNTLAKQYGNNWLDRAMAQEPSGLLGPVRLLVTRRNP